MRFALLFMLLILGLTACQNLTLHQEDSYDNQITAVLAKQAEGVGLSTFIFELYIQDPVLDSLLEQQKIDVIFQAAISYLNQENKAKIYKIKPSTYHLIVGSSLWADIDEAAFDKKFNELLTAVNIKLIASQDNLSWQLQGFQLTSDPITQKFKHQE